MTFQVRRMSLVELIYIPDSASTLSNRLSQSWRARLLSWLNSYYYEVKIRDYFYHLLSSIAGGDRILYIEVGTFNE